MTPASDHVDVYACRQKCGRAKHRAASAICSARRAGWPIGWIAIAVAVIAILVWSEVLPADTPGEPVRRLRGIINRDESWSGRLLITADLSIEDATVTVAPGTMIEFAGGDPDGGPVLRVGTDARRGGLLILNATVAAPIVFRGGSNTPRGRVIVRIQDRPSSRPDPAETSAAGSRAPAGPGQSIVWRHVRFEGMGKRNRPREADGHAEQAATAALTIDVIGRDQPVEMSSCVFDRSGCIAVHLGDGGRFRMADSRIDRCAGPIAIEIDGRPDSPIGRLPGGRRDDDRADGKNAAPDQVDKPTRACELNGSRFAGTVHIADVSAAVVNNVLIGEFASIVVDDATRCQTRIEANYVHNTVRQDIGRHCLDCRRADAEIVANVFQGGSDTVLNGSRHMTANVFIGSDSMIDAGGRVTSTRHLVAGLPAGAVFAENLLLGPATAMLSAQPATIRDAAGSQSARPRPTVIRNNVFDAQGIAERAILLNRAGSGFSQVAVFDNVFLRTKTAVFDAGRSNNTVVLADHNAFAPRPARLYDCVHVPGAKPRCPPFSRRPEVGVPPDPGWGGNDLIRDDVTSLGLPNAGSVGRTDDFDGPLWSGKMGLSQLHDRLVSRYRSRAGGPLLDAGMKPDRARWPAPIGVIGLPPLTTRPATGTAIVDQDPDNH